MRCCSDAAAVNPRHGFVRRDLRTDTTAANNGAQNFVALTGSTRKPQTASFIPNCCSHHFILFACTQARYLKFCQDYNAQSCCIPGHDLENQVQFENLIEALGPGCKNPMMYPEVRFFYCLGCDPDQPSYTVGNTINICQSFLNKMWRDPSFDDCGVMYSNPCPTNWVDADFDPYQCGDTLLLPKVPGSMIDNNVTLFINTFKPPGLEDFDFVPVDDVTLDANGNRIDDRECWIARTYSSSAGSARPTGSASLYVTLALGALALALQLLLG